ncbi:hypothetical protein GCM10025857_22650 [Alicyclobacillus contaminans]|nr:hypothetical protein GCM10025857_22650 [Alicyclobacillus contaminans]
MKKWKGFAAAAAVATLAAGLAGCSTTTGTTSPASSSSSAAFTGQSGETYYMITFLSGIEYWKGVLAGAKEAAKDLHVNVVYTGAPQYDINQEATTLQQVIAKKPAGILITSINEKALTPYINQAIQAGIPVIAFDSDAPSSQRYSYLGTSNVEAGQTAADYLGQKLGGTARWPSSARLESSTSISGSRDSSRRWHKSIPEFRWSRWKTEIRTKSRPHR